jgi:hypothetical protein
MPVSNQNRTFVQVAINQSAAGSTDLVAAPGAGVKIYVVAIVLSNSHSAAGTFRFAEGTGPTSLTGDMQMAASGGGAVIIGDGKEPVLQTNTANSKLTLITATGFCDGWIRYFIDT